MQIEATVDKILFESFDGTFVVAKVKAPNPWGKDDFNVCGQLGRLIAGETLTVIGEWEKHPRHGHQFKAKDVKSTQPVSLEGIVRFLGSGNFPGIGPKIAQKIVDRWGEDTLDILNNNLDVLLVIPGITERKLEKIKLAWSEYHEMQDLMVFLDSHGVTGKIQQKIYKKWGPGSISHIKRNPYLLTEIDGVGFKRADRVALAVGVDTTSADRITSGLIYTLQKSTEEGHVYLPQDETVLRTSEELGIPSELVENVISELHGNKVVTEGNRLYWRPIHKAEFIVASSIAEIYRTKSRAYDKKEQIMPMLDRSELSTEQKAAVERAFDRGISCMTGGPGTGKTRTIQEFAQCATQCGLSIDLGAPTGRAAQRMSLSHLGLEGKTIHRLLEYKPYTNSFGRNSRNPLTSHVVIIDEASMMDVWIARRLFDAIQPGITSVILVGDADQLPSVGPGRVFEEIIEAGIPTVRLSHIYRHGKGSEIAENAKLINRGDMPVMQKPGGGDFFFIEREDEEEAAATVVDMAAKYLDLKYWIPPNRVQVLSPLYRGAAGIESLNRRMQESLNPHGREAIPGKGIKIGCRVMQTVNNYKLDDGNGVFNGDIGKVVSSDPSEGNLVVDFGDRKVNYRGREVENLVLAWAVSIHKAQGSEFDAVVIPVLKSQYIFLERCLIYTGITRAKAVVCLVGSKKALAIATKKASTLKRNSSLSDRIIHELHI